MYTYDVDYLTAIDIDISIFWIYGRQNLDTGANLAHNLSL